MEKAQETKQEETKSKTIGEKIREVVFGKKSDEETSEVVETTVETEPTAEEPKADEVQEDVLSKEDMDAAIEKAKAEAIEEYKKAEAEKDNVEIKQYSIIYQAIEDVETAMKGMLDPKYVERIIGTAEIRQTFRISSVGTIGGAFVLTGKIERNAGVRVIRDEVVIHEGKLASLKRFKDDAKEVNKGFECGMQIENYNDIKEGDIIEAFVMDEVKR